MRNDERLRTIYEVMAPYIVRNEHNWRDYLAFASQFHKHSFDNILLVYAQDEDVSILATRKQWATIGRNLIPRAKGVAVCVYRNAKLTLDYLFDVSQTTGKEIHPTDWQLSDEMKKALTERLSYAHGFPKQDFPQALYAMASESVAENYNHFLQELKQETKGHLFTEIPAGGFEAQYIQLLTDSISYFIGKKCHLPDEEIQLSDGMATVSHFNTLPLVAHLGTAVTALSKGILLEVERNIKIINRERMAQHEQTEYQSEIQGAGRDDASRSANLQQQRSRSTSGQVRPDGPGIPQRESPGAIYDFENGWQSDGDHAPGTGRGDREDRSPDAANAPAGAASADRGHHGADATPEQSETDGGGNRTPERSPDSPLTEEQPNTEVAPSAAPVGEPSEKDGSFSVPAEQPTRHFTDAEVRRNYEYILTSTNLYPPELHSAVRSVLSEPPLNPDWSDKGRQIAALFTPYGDREYQGDFLYRTRLHGEDGISFFFDEGYTYIPWNGLAFLLDAMIEDGDYPNPVVEEQPDPIGDYNIPDEVDEMGGPHRQMTIGEADFDYVLDAVAYEAGETVVEPVKPQAIVQMENDTPAAGDEPASVPDENPPVVVEAPETALPTDTAEQPTPPPVKGNTTAHKNFRRFQELFPEIVSGQYEYLRLEAGEAYYPLVIHHKYGSHYCMEHYYMQNGDRMYDPYMDFQIDKEAGTLRAFSYENSGIGVYNEANPDDPAYEKAINGFNSFFATWLNNIRSQGYEPVRASMMVNDEEVDVDLRPAAEAVPVVEEEQPEQLSLLSLEKSTEDLLVERVMQRGPLTAGKKEQIYEFAQTHPTGSEFTAFLKKLYGYEGFSGDEMGVKYAMFNSEGVTIEWQDEQGETQETKLSWARAAGVVQRLVDEGRYLETPVVSLPEPETDEPLEGETEPYDYSFEYGLLGRLKADCEYFLSEGHQHEKHLWAGSIHAQIAKMRELYDLLPEKPEGITKEIIDDYETRMAPWEHDEAEETQILDEALDAHHGQIDMLMQAVRGELTVGTIRYSIFEGRPHISMIEVLEDYRRQGIATQMLRYLQGQYPNEEIVWGYLTEDGSALYQAVVDEQPNPDYLRVQNDLEDITREFDAYVRRLDGGAILSPQEAADMDDLEDTQYRLEKELEELRPIRTFVRMGDGTAAEAPAVMDEATSTDLAPLREPPAAPQVATHNFRFSEDYDLYPSGAKTKYKNNVMAIKLLKQIELEKRTATPEEQIILARYVGWGGLANAFSSTASGWENEYQELKSLLTDVEYKAAMNSTITAYYTEPDLIRHIYRALERFGFEGGPDRKILDPGMGTGNFYSVLPEQFQGSKLFGVELDSITGRIAKQLYPDADISIMGYEATKFEDNSFDVILGNIPFNSVKIYDRRYNDLNPYIHDYFFIKSLDLAKPGGIIAFITSKGIMDRKDESLREYIARRAEFIGAIRLPNTAFKALAGTDVTADVVFLKKRVQPIELDRANLPSWIETDLDRSKWIAYNRYFKDNPEMLMGEMVSSRNMYGNEDGTACVAPEDFDLNQHLTQAVDSLYARFTAEPDEEIEADEPEESNTEYEDAPAGTKNFTYVVRNGEIFFCEKDKLIPQPYTGMKAERIKGLCEIRTALLEVINIQSHEYDPVDLQKVQDTLNQVYDRFVAKYAIHEIKSENGENWSVKQMVIFRKNLDERLKKLSAEEKKDDLLTFEQLGVDMMMVDEAHFFKNCFVFTKLRNVAGITTSSSQRAFDMLLKCQYLQETNQGRGVVFATGTPISNSISELFVMQRYLQPQELERFGWSYFDTWIAHFAKKASVLELKPEGGGYRMRDRFVRFYNLPELMAVFREVADIKTADMLDIPGLPAVRTGKAEIVSVEATPAQQAIMADFILRAEAIRTGRVKPEEDNMLKLTGEARLMAIDPRLIRPDADGTGSKLSVCIEDVYQVWKDTAASASTQLVFCDVGTPKAGKFNVYDEIRNVLLAKGVPESEIAFVHDATSEAQRQELFERTRQGKVRILIGSTSKLGTGVNVQNKVISIDHLDCPWKPSDITQRNGRGVRQGNENPEIMIKQFVAKGTFDAYLWQIQEQKLRYITQILTGKHIARSCEDVDETVLSAAQFKAAATDNPMVAQKMELENRVTELKILRGAWSNEQLALEHKVNLTYPSRIREYEQKIERVTQDISLLGQTEGKDFSIVLDGKHYTERPAAGEAFALLYRMISEGRGKDEYEFEIGSYPA